MVHAKGDTGRIGKFDLDPCAPIHPLWPTAEVMYDQNIDGLSQIWEGRVWLNPPYSRPLIELFVRKWQNMATALHYYSTVAIPKVSGRHISKADGE